MDRAEQGQAEAQLGPHAVPGPGHQRRVLPRPGQGGGGQQRGDLEGLGRLDREWALVRGLGALADQAWPLTGLLFC